jgi:hypothetical protein
MRPQAEPPNASWLPLVSAIGCEHGVIAKRRATVCENQDFWNLSFASHRRTWARLARRQIQQRFHLESLPSCSATGTMIAFIGIDGDKSQKPQIGSAVISANHIRLANKRVYRTRVLGG